MMNIEANLSHYLFPFNIQVYVANLFYNLCKFIYLIFMCIILEYK